MKVTPPSTPSKPEYSSRVLLALATAATTTIAVGCRPPLGGAPLAPPAYHECREANTPSSSSTKTTDVQQTPASEDSSDVRVRGRIEAEPIVIEGAIDMDPDVPDEPPTMGEIAAVPEEPAPTEKEEPAPPLMGKVAPPPPGAPVSEPEP